MNSDIVCSEIDKISSHLQPRVTTNDQFGHRANINNLISYLNSQCQDIRADSVFCYACIKTNPPQTEIAVTTDSSGVQVRRIIDIFTPSDGIMSCRTMHRDGMNDTVINWPRVMISEGPKWNKDEDDRVIDSSLEQDSSDYEMGRKDVVYQCLLRGFLWSASTVLTRRSGAANWQELIRILGI